MPFGRIIMRIMVFDMSAVFMHIAAHTSIPGAMVIEPAHMVQACSQAEHASMHSCIIAMSIPSIESECISIICIAVFDIVFVQPGLSRVGRSGGVVIGPIPFQLTPRSLAVSAPRP